MEILIFLAAVVAVSLWIKHQYPDSAASQLINSSYELSLTLLKKSNSILNSTATTSDEASLTDSHQQQPATAKNQDVELPLVTTATSTSNDPATFINQIPEDSVLKRHYLTQLAFVHQSNANLHPADTAVYNENESQLNSIATEANPFQSQVLASVVKQKINIPEDAVLRRHFLTQLRAEIEATLFPRPTDSTLVRHYESLIQSEIYKHVVISA